MSLVIVLFSEELAFIAYVKHKINKNDAPYKNLLASFFI
ncbi:hypothetical protein RU98_GL001259 [Enterococcus caccae]|nr:hypothetical protein RU98_GL001259 [Enterococcus caccae]